MVTRPTRSPSAAAPARSGQHSAASRRFYRLVDQEGAPHPVLDDLYDSLEAAWSEAQAWWVDQSVQGPPAIGVEVSTTSGDWRTLRAPGG